MTLAQLQSVGCSLPHLLNHYFIIKLLLGFTWCHVDCRLALRSQEAGYNLKTPLLVGRFANKRNLLASSDWTTSILLENSATSCGHSVSSRHIYSSYLFCISLSILFFDLGGQSCLCTLSLNVCTLFIVLGINTAELHLFPLQNLLIILASIFYNSSNNNINKKYQLIMATGLCQ